VLTGARNELAAATKNFIEMECEKSSDHLLHKKCGGAIKVGFLHLFHQNDDGSLDPGSDGFGIGPKKFRIAKTAFLQTVSSMLTLLDFQF